MVRANYPLSLLEVMVICSIDDTGTIAKAQQKIAQLRRRGVTNVQVIAFKNIPINKPHGLNVGLRHAHNEVVTIFDAEDDIHPDIFNVVNTVMLEEKVSVVQCGVQLMNYQDKWYSALNVLEYFFWFKSRLHYHARLGMTPLGGNTVFFTRQVLERVGGWDEQDLTEDADIGIRLSLMGERMRVVYDDTAAIGRLYRRQDEVGTPYCVTVDVQTVGDSERGETGDLRVTIRERDSMEQIRLPIVELTPVFRELLDGASWTQVAGRYPSARS